MNVEWRWPLGAAALAAALYFANCFLPETWLLLPWALSLVFIGLPHGALDHEVVLNLWRPQPPPRWALTVTLAGYLLTAGLVMVGWFLCPQLVFCLFILLTWAHWGLGDLWWSWQRDPAYFTSGFHRFLFALWRGALPMLLPLVVAPKLYRGIAESVCLLFTKTAPDLRWMQDFHLRESVILFVLSLGLLELSVANRTSGSYLLAASESLLLFSIFLTFPPLISIGYYFVFWHGLRHVLRLMRAQHLTFSRFALRSAPATVAALMLLAFLAAAVLQRETSPKFLALYLALIAALTVPHAAVVTWMDRRDRVY